MNIEASLHSFYSSFGLIAYEENTVPTGDDSPLFPYLTYSISTSGFGEETSMSINLWYRSNSWKEINLKKEEIEKRIGAGGIILSCNDGKIWIKKGSPFSQNMGDEKDDLIRRKYINITAEFLTAE